MKKLISLLLAVSVMAMSTCALAAPSLKAEGQRNPGSWDDANRNSDWLRDYKTANQAAVYRPGDTITFSKGNEVTFAAGDVVTFISSYVDAEDLTSSTVMFIDQVKVDSASPSFSYKIREGLAEGIYKIDIKIGSADADTFYYAIGDPKVEIAYVDEAETVQYYYDEEDNKTYYFASATLGTGDLTYNQLGVAEFGFDFGNGNVFTMPASTFDAAVAAQEIEGTINWFFSIGVSDVTEENIPTAADALVDEQ